MPQLVYLHTRVVVVIVYKDHAPGVDERVRRPTAALAMASGKDVHNVLERAGEGETELFVGRELDVAADGLLGGSVEGYRDGDVEDPWGREDGGDGGGVVLRRDLELAETAGLWG